MTSVRVVACPRIHMGLVDVGEASRRSYGGIGFSIAGKQTIWRARHDKRVRLSGISHLDVPARQDLENVVSRLSRTTEGAGFCAHLEQVAEQHVGFGTKTSLCLSLIAAISALHNSNLT